MRRLAELVTELRRRRVFRVALFYLAIAWGVIEVGDTVLPRLGLPDWTVTLVVVLAALGFPVAVGLAWAFDADSGRIRRTDGGTSRTAGRRTVVFAAAAVAVVALLLLGFWPSDGHPVVDNRKIAVLPFEVSGAEPDLAYLGIGLMELVSAGLRDSTLSALPPDVVRQAMRQLDHDDRMAPPISAATEVARRAGARFALHGRIVGGRRGVIVNVDLIDLENPEQPVRFSTRLPPDDLHGLGEDIVVQAMAARGGVPAQHLAALTTTSPAALQHYLQGVERHRKGDYASALRSYAEALVEDSTFAMAALEYVGIRGMTFVRVPQFDAGTIAWAHRNRLPPDDRTYLETLGPPGGRALWHEQFGRIEDAARVSQHDARLQLRLGWAYAVTGRAVGIQDAEERGVRALERSYRLDPRTPAAADWLFSLAVRRRDEAAARRWHDVVMALDSTSRPTGLSIRWSMAILSGDVGAARALDYASDPANVIELVWRTKAHQAHARETAEELERALSGAAGTGRGLLAYNIALQAMAEGRPSRLWSALDEAEWGSPIAMARLNLWFAHFWVADAIRARAALALLEQVASSPETTPKDRVLAVCAASQYHADRRDAERALAAVRPLREDAALAAAWPDGAAICIESVEAWVAHIRDAPDAADRLSRLDRDIERATGWDFHFLHGIMIPVQVINARIWEERGDLERARELHGRVAIQRWPDLWVDRLGEEGRLSELLGDTAAAIHAYERYLAVRTRPEPPFDTVTRRVTTRLAALRDASR